MASVAREIRLNLGSRDRKMDGFLNYDCDAHPGVDYVGDVSNLSIFGNCSVSEIYASHIIEHFPHPKTLSVLKEWHRVLAPGGKLYVAVPDFARCVEIYGSIGLDQWIVNFLSGDQGYKTAYHYNLFDEPRLSKYLADAGFSDSVRVEEFPIGDENDCSNLASNIDGERVSLNLVATK